MEIQQNTKHMRKSTRDPTDSCSYRKLSRMLQRSGFLPITKYAVRLREKVKSRQYSKKQK